LAPFSGHGFVGIMYSELELYRELGSSDLRSARRDYKAFRLQSSSCSIVYFYIEPIRHLEGSRKAAPIIRPVEVEFESVLVLQSISNKIV